MRSPNMPSVSMLNFAQAPTPQIPRSRFDRSHGHTTTIDADYLYPVLVDEILPSDSVNLESTFFLRINTLLHPIMDNLHFDLFAFFVPFRLVWENWQKFMGEQANPDSPTDYVIPILHNDVSPAMVFSSDSLHAYMGLPMEKDIYPYDPVSNPNGQSISALYARAYALIWNQWFRDENLQNSIPVPLGDGPDHYASYTLLKRNKRKDMGTAALPWQQKGDPVMLPLGTTAPVVGDGYAMGLDDGTLSNKALGFRYAIPSQGVPYFDQSLAGSTVGTQAAHTGGSTAGDLFSVGLSQSGANSHVYADLTQATAISVNDLRLAVTVQQLKEMYARGGTRYVELLRVEFGAISPDFRLQRAEFLAGSSKMMQISAVPQTAPSTDDGSPQANLAAYGVHSDRLRVNYNATEHGILMVMANVRADIRYQSTINKKFTRRTMLEFFHPTLQHLGEEAVFGREINYMTNMPSDYNNSVFGYQERYYDYRYAPSIVTGKMNSAAPGSLDVWTLAQNFGNNPVFLNGEFIESSTPMDRVVAVPSEPVFYCDIWHKYHHTRPMAVRSIPGLTRF